jgi:hypothetical protein
MHMLLVMRVADREPFDNSLVQFGLGGDSARSRRAHDDMLQAMRVRAEHWGVAHGFEVVESSLVRRAESVEVTIRWSDIAEMCTVRSSALQPIRLQLKVEPKSWTDWLSARLGERFETADRAFDEHWHVAADDEPVARRLLDERVRTALLNHPIWCRVVYSNGQIDLLLDSGKERLTGGHLLAATEVAIALGRATPRPPTMPYR